MTADRQRVSQTAAMSAPSAVSDSGLLRRYFPIVAWLPTYHRAWLKDDAIAGLSVWALLVPQSLAYATLVGVPAQYGHLVRVI
jgi:MFS superfamily sulfate permease-like transporter